MDPVLLEIPNLPILGDLRFHSYAAMVALAFLVSTLLAASHGARLKKPIYVPPQGAVWALLGGFIGAKLYWILQYSEPKYLWHAVLIWEPGLVFYGGVMGGFVAVAIYLYVTKTFDWRVGDAVAPYLALGQAFGRMGCFLNGCCWGKVCDYPWAISFPRGSYPLRQHIKEGLLEPSAAASLHVHPTQLYSVVGLVTICLILAYRLSRNYNFTFSIFLEYMFLYGLLRFTVEMFRGDSVRSVLNIMTVSQTVSLILIVFSSIVYTILEKRHQRKLTTTVTEPT